MVNKLTIKQEKFVQGLFAGLSQREAYKQAYNAENMTDAVIDVRGCELAKNSKVRVRLEELKNELKERNIITVEWVLNNLKHVAERCMQAEPVMIREGNKMVESGEYTFQHAGANKALELLGKHLGMFTDKIETSGETTVNNNINLKHISTEDLKKLIADDADD